MQHITYDFETLGNTYNAPVIQIGAVKFNEQGEILDRFHCIINWKSLEKYHFTIDYSTLQWWFSQPKEAQDTLFNGGEVMNIEEAFSAFQKWIGNLKDYNYWSHATFDAVIFANHCKMMKRDVFIPFRLQRDIRTLNFLAGNVEVKREGMAHCAIDDAIFQAEYISKMINKIK